MKNTIRILSNLINEACKYGGNDMNQSVLDDAEKLLNQLKGSKPKRYWIFIYEEYYPLGGMQDLSGCFDTVGECRIHHSKVQQNYRNLDFNSPPENYEIYDSITRKILDHSDTLMIDTVKKELLE